jgi:membrane protease YdiL (CAAX protease family)
VVLVVGLVIALVLYAAVSLTVRRPSPTPLDFRDVTAPAYLLLQVAVAVLVLALLPIPYEVDAIGLARGYAAGLAFVGAPQLVGIARRECIRLFEINYLYPVSSILPRELLLCAATFPAIAVCEEVALRGVAPGPEAAVAAAQWLVYLAGSRTGVGAPAIACAFLAALHQRTGSLEVVIGAHAAIQTLTGRLRSPGLFGAVYPLLEQAKWKNLAPAWRQAAVELGAAALLIGLAR